MNIGLIDVDSHNFPNLCLMKISAYHKGNGDAVEWFNGFKHYDRVYMSKVFDETYSPDFNYAINADEIIKGGTGYGLDNKLPDAVEHIMPDYSLYGITDTAYGFLTRGCPRGCSFCIVSDKEGRRSKQVAELDEFYDVQSNICLLDANILASPNADELLEQLVQTGAYIDFSQGLDARLLTNERINLLIRMKVKRLHFAWDNSNDQITPKYLIELSKTNVFKMQQVSVYVLTNYNSTHEEDLYRVNKIKEMGFYPYVMIYDKPNAPLKTRHLARWVNNKILFNICDTFEEYQQFKRIKKDKLIKKV